VRAGLVAVSATDPGFPRAPRTTPSPDGHAGRVRRCPTLQFLRVDRTTIVDGETRTSVSYAITSLPPERASPAKLLELWRGRRAIENRLFRLRDVVFGEDHGRIRTGTAALAPSHVRNAAINDLRARKVDDNAAALRENALEVEALLRELGILKH
jgi:hypothetical protein